MSLVTDMIGNNRYDRKIDRKNDLATLYDHLQDRYEAMAADYHKLSKTAREQHAEIQRLKQNQSQPSNQNEK